MVESRCGLLCSKCEWGKKEGCVGCIAMSKPLWSDSCDIKSCCEEKGLEHCGLCDDFPCKTITDMQEDEDDNRIEQCRIWAVSQ